MTYIVYATFAVGCYLSLLNLYLSALRYPLFRLRGGATDDYQWISAVPVIGSLLIVLSLPLFPGATWLRWTGLICAILDTGGLHWFVGAMLYMACRGKL